VDETGRQVAIKLLLKTKPVAYARFRSEITALKLVAGIEGVLKVVEDHLPAQLGAERPWYAMPVATPILRKIQTFGPRESVVAISQVAETMAHLHAKGISHRDIKPANLLLYERRCHIGDFGLVDYPSKTGLTGAKERLGPGCTMSPEVRRSGNRADPFPADVYSLAKTLWILLTRDQKGFEGRYDAEGDISIRKFCGDMYITSLEKLLSESTEHRSERRPRMREFAERLVQWLQISEEYREYNRLQWADVQQKLFPIMPARASWDNLDDIIAILNILGGTSDLNHLFFPSGGGLDLDQAVRSVREPDCIELVTNGCTQIVKPVRLLFESFNDDLQWNYFRLETGGLAPSEVYCDTPQTELYEEVTDLGGQTYVSFSAWNNNEYLGKPLPEGSRAVTRFYRGAFVIFQKSSIYNSVPATYDGRHNKMSSDDFRASIATVVAHRKKRKGGPV
jgi:serine/threonine protein kinase